MAISFLGTSRHTLDDKGRLIVPRRFLEEIAPKDAVFTVTASVDGCLLLMDRSTWTQVAESFQREVLVDAHQRSVRRLLLGHADVVSPDRSGRIGLNESLREFAGIPPQGEAVLVGTGRCAEIWSPTAYAEVLQAARQVGEFFDRPIERSETAAGAS